ncbi:hypothetical protein EJ08DRAFT_696614 [Tothia fuscella]|uniref:Uncharacterized protein n=1 Tax=Tothia fuscella TaxID=1048955 RepID=A0A9P4TZB7_9PEZI|nr:hypothetical protein EJ08DRAFT_696614 [Tothia fuscella]
MSAGPALHIFPPVEQVIRRRESLDDLIRKSMDMRPAGPWPLRTEAPAPRPRINKGRTGGNSSPSNAIPAINVQVYDEPTANFYPGTAVSTASAINMSHKATPFQMLPPIQVPSQMPSRPRRSSSLTERSRQLHSGSTLAQRRARSPSATRRYRESPVSARSDDNTATPVSAQSTITTPISPPERLVQSRSSNRQRVVFPNSNGGEVATFYAPGTQMNLERQGSSRASNRNQVSEHGVPRRQTSSRSSNPTRGGIPTTAESKRSATPAFSDVGSTHSDSPTLVRSNSTMTVLKSSPQRHDQSAPTQSLFPVYDPRISLASQAYRPARVVSPMAMLAPEKVSKQEYAPAPQFQVQETTATSITPASDLGSLWAATNGQMSTPDPRNFALKMYRPASSEQKKQKITFGPSESQPFYSLTKTHPITVEEDDDHEHELLLSRHHQSKEDILPLSHMQLQPPPPPTISRSHRSSILSDIHQPATHITTIAPIMATLHSLDHAAKTPQAHTLALVDPNATSPAAARLAERAVAEATARESCTLTWTPTCPRYGKYELHHPSLGVFTIVTEGDVANSLESGSAYRPASISIVNPFANMTPLTTSPSSFGSASSTRTAFNDFNRDGSIIARLDLQEDILHLDAASIQQLGNLYLIDVCVSAILAVAVAEAKRPADPGLVFAAPPPSLLNVSLKSKKSKALIPKKPKKVRKVRSAGKLGLGIDHLADKDDLPRLTKGVLSVLGFSFNTAIYLLALGFKVTASMVLGISKLATKD